MIKVAEHKDGELVEYVCQLAPGNPANSYNETFNGVNFPLYIQERQGAGLPKLTKAKTQHLTKAQAEKIVREVERHAFRGKQVVSYVAESNRRERQPMAGDIPMSDHITFHPVAAAVPDVSDAEKHLAEVETYKKDLAAERARREELEREVAALKESDGAEAGPKAKKTRGKAKE